MDDHIVVDLALMALVFTLIKFEVWLIRRIHFFAYVILSCVSGKSRRVHFTDVIQIYRIILPISVIIATGWLCEA